MSVLVTNNAVGYLQVGVNSAETSILVKPGQGVRFPSPVLDQDWFYITVENEEGDVEVMKCTKRSGDTLTVQRGQDGTVGHDFKADSLVELRPCAGLFNDKVDVDKFNAKIAELQQTIQQFKTEINLRVSELSAETTTYITELKDFVADTYLPLAGGKLTGAVDSTAGITITGILQAGGFKITPKETEGTGDDSGTEEGTE